MHTPDTSRSCTRGWQKSATRTKVPTINITQRLPIEELELLCILRPLRPIFPVRDFFLRLGGPDFFLFLLVAWLLSFSGWNCWCIPLHPCHFERLSSSLVYFTLWSSLGDSSVLFALPSYSPYSNPTLLLLFSLLFFSVILRTLFCSSLLHATLFNSILYSSRTLLCTLLYSAGFCFWKRVPRSLSKLRLPSSFCHHCPSHRFSTCPPILPDYRRCQ